MCTCGHRVSCALADTVGCLIPRFSVQKGARERPLCGHYAPSIRTSAEPALMQARSRLLPDNQSGITSRKCGLRGRPRGFRVPFGTGPMFNRPPVFTADVGFCSHIDFIKFPKVHGLEAVDGWPNVLAVCALLDKFQLPYTRYIGQAGLDFSHVRHLRDTGRF